MGSHRQVPVAELQELAERGLKNIENRREADWVEMKNKLVKHKNEKRKKGWFVRLGLRKFVEYTDADAEKALKEHGGAFEPSEHWKLYNWRYSKSEECFERLLKLCKVANREHHIALDAKDGELLYNWTAGG